MSVPLLEAIADAIYAYEGNRPPSRAYMNRNPGNLRTWGSLEEHDAEHFCVFPTFLDGYSALLDDLRDKVTGKTITGLSSRSTLAQLISVWAPAGDGNDPDSYAEFVALQLAKTYSVPVSARDSLADLFLTVAKEPIPDGEPATANPA